VKWPRRQRPTQPPQYTMYPHSCEVHPGLTAGGECSTCGLELEPPRSETHMPAQGEWSHSWVACTHTGLVIICCPLEEAERDPGLWEGRTVPAVHAPDRDVVAPA
jgi:hypothetical protein